jgi:glycosyltransferase involved in cell wall biosynthesis
VKQWVGPLELLRHTSIVRDIITRFNPNLVHAMRIPFEGIVAANAIPSGVPLLLSVWGNDFTLHANRASLTKVYTRRALRRADALHCDCARDLRLAEGLGMSAHKPAIVLPGAGGIQRDLFTPGDPDEELRRQLDISRDAPVVINPRGFRAYVRNDVFFASIPSVLQAHPDAVFICTGMSRNAVAEKWVTQYGVRPNVRLLPNVSRAEMAQLFRLATVSVSPSTHDGTPNTLLEAMACGCFPVAGDIDSVREWIDDGVNGLLFNPADTDALSRLVIRALRERELREKAICVNSRLIDERAEYGGVMRRAEEFYRKVIGQGEAAKI